jgi:zinc protease
MPPRRARRWLAVAHLLTALSCATPPPLPPAPPPPPDWRARAPAIEGLQARPIPPKAGDWRAEAAWARKAAAGLADDLACGQAVRRWAAEAPDGTKAFALAVACAKQDKLRDLRLLFLRPWRTFLFELPPEEAARLLAQVIALRGGVADDVAFCRDRGLLIHILKDLPQTDRRSERYVVVRGRVQGQDTLPRGQVSVDIEETSQADLVVGHWNGYGTYYAYQPHIKGTVQPTGRFLSGTAPAGMVLQRDKELVFLARIPADRHASDDDEVLQEAEPEEAQLLAVWSAGVPLPSMAEDLRDRGIDAQDLESERYLLPNGLTVVLHPDPSLPLVHVNLTYRVGTYHEAEGQSGFAHLFEHMMFQGSRDVAPGQHLALLESRGASFVNAFTTFDRTSYVQTLPSHELELALWLEADRMASLPEGLTEASLEREKRVVRNERRERTEDDPYGPVEQLVLRNLFAPGHPYREGVIGAVKDLEAATVDDARAFFEDFYGPTNATLVVAGLFDADQAKAWIAQYFGVIPPRPVRTLPPPAPPKLHGSPELQMRLPLARHTRITLVWPGPSAYGRGAAELTLFGHLLSDDGVGLLSAELEGLKFEVRGARAGLRETLAGTWFQVDVELAKDTHDRADLLMAVERILASFQNNGLIESDLGALARSIERSTLFSLETLRARAGLLAYFDHLFADPVRLRWVLAQYQGITVGSMNAALHTYLTTERLLIVATPGARAAEKKEPTP